MTVLPPPLHRAYRRPTSSFDAESVEGLALWYPINGNLYQDSALTTPAGAGDPVGAREDHSGSDHHAIQATTSKKPTLDKAGPGVKYDEVDDLLVATYALNPAAKFAAMLALWARNDADKFTTVALQPLKAALVEEYAIRIEPGDNIQCAMPANWNANAWEIVCAVVPDFTGSDGTTKNILVLVKDANNYIQLAQAADGTLYANARVGGVDNALTAVPSPGWVAGQVLWIGLRLASGSLTLYVDTNNDGALNTSTDASVGSYASSSGWTAFVGQSGSAGVDTWLGGINALITGAAAATPITDRYAAAGAGQALGDWLNTWQASLVLSFGGRADAIGISTGVGSTSPTDGLSEGRYDLGGTHHIDAGNLSALNAAAKAVFMIEVEIDDLSASRTLLERGAIGTDGCIFADVQTDGTLRVFIPTAAGDSGTFKVTNAAVFTAGQRKRVWIVYDGTQGTAANRVRIYSSLLNASTNQYGAITEAASTATGALPAALLTPGTTTNLRFGRRNASTFGLDGKIDDVRIVVGSVFDPTAANLTDSINEPMPWVWQYWWPFDGNANATLGGLNGTVSGATQVADGRHRLGTFERYIRQGQYYFDGVNDEISLGNYTGLDGAAAFSMFGVFTPATVSAYGVLFSRWEGSGGKLVFIVSVSSAGKIEIRLTNDGAAQAIATGDAALVAGTPYALWIRYEGSGAANADRLRFALATYAPATGTWGAFVEQTVAFTGASVPASLVVPGSTTVYFGREVAGSFFNGLIDGWWLRPDAQSVAALNALTVYNYLSTPAAFTWSFNGSANSDAGVLNGTVSGAIQWYDGRQPEGWTQSTLGEIDRATGADVQYGTYALRLGLGARWDYPSIGTLAAGQLLLWQVRGRKAAGASEGLAVPNTGAVGATISDLAQTQKFRAQHSPAGTFSLALLQPSGAVGSWWLDTVELVKYAQVTPSVATKGVSSRIIWSASKAGSIGPFVFIGIDTSEKLKIGFRNDAGAYAEAAAAGSMTIGVHSVSLEFDGTTLRGYVDNVLAVSLAIAGTFTGLDTVALGGIKAYVEGHIFDERQGEYFLHVGRAYTAIERKRLHNYLASVTTGLAAA